MYLQIWKANENIKGIKVCRRHAQLLLLTVEFFCFVWQLSIQCEDGTLSKFRCSWIWFSYLTAYLQVMPLVSIFSASVVVRTPEIISSSTLPDFISTCRVRHCFSWPCAPSLPGALLNDARSVPLYVALMQTGGMVGLNSPQLVLLCLTERQHSSLYSGPVTLFMIWYWTDFTGHTY